MGPDRNDDGFVPIDDLADLFADPDPALVADQGSATVDGSGEETVTDAPGAPGHATAAVIGPDPGVDAKGLDDLADEGLADEDPDDEDPDDEEPSALEAVETEPGDDAPGEEAAGEEAAGEGPTDAEPVDDTTLAALLDIVDGLGGPGAGSAAAVTPTGPLPLTAAPAAGARSPFAAAPGAPFASPSGSPFAAQADGGWDPALLARWERAEAMYSEVNTILAVIAADAQLTREIGSMVVTRDAEVDNRQKFAFRHHLNQTLAASGRRLLINPRDIEAVMDLVYDEVIGLGPLGLLWRDDRVTEILVDGPTSVYAERDGRLVATPLRFRDLDHAQRLARTLSEKISQRKVSPANPLVTAELPGARIAICYGSGVVKSGVSLTIRKFRPLLGMTALRGVGALSDEMAAFLDDAVVARATIVVSGGTGTGKTTMVNALSESIPDSERIVTIEDAFELQLANRWTVGLQTKEAASGDDTVSVSQADLLVQSLRMRPDRIVVGEIREPHGAQVFVQAANTGHDGSLTTIHANSADAAVNFRLTGLLRTATGMSDDVAVREVATAVDLVVQITRRAGRRFVSEVALVDIANVGGNAVTLVPLFRARELDDGSLEFIRAGGVGADTVLAHKLAEAGLDARRWEGPA